MIVKTIILAFIAACGVHSNPQTEALETLAAPDDGPNDIPPDATKDGQYYCCTSVDAKNLTGDGCIGISGETTINSCPNVLYCEGSHSKVNGTVTCSEKCKD